MEIDFEFWRAVFILGLYFYWLSIAIAFWVKIARKRREIFPDDKDYYYKNGGFHLFPGPDVDDDRFREYKLEYYRIYKTEAIKFFALLVVIIILLYQS